MSDPTLLSARELEESYRGRRLSPVELVKATLDKIDRLNPELNAFRVVDPEGAFAAARDSESRWMRGEPLTRLDGVTFAVKDLLLARGHPTLYGSRAVSPDQTTDQDAPAAARLRESGAVFLGKTTTSEFGWKGTADSPLTGVVRNPHDLSKTSGGSSGGAAAAAATGLGVFQLGTDGGGSVRIPASFCGVFGMKATFGRVSAWPAGPMMTLSNVGPITRRVDDAARMLDVITRPDPRDWYALPAARLDFERRVDVKNLKLGLYIRKPESPIDPEIEKCIRNLAAQLASLGAQVDEIELPLRDAYEILLPHWHSGALHLVSQIPEEKRHLVDEGLRAAAERGARLTIEQLYRATFLRQRLGEALQAALRPFDAIITPTVPILPFESGRQWPSDASYDSWLEWACYLFPFNLSRQPAASVPVGVSSTGLPIGAQIAGALYGDEEVMRIARAVEAMVMTR